MERHEGAGEEVTYVYRRDEPPVVQVARVAETRPDRTREPFNPELCGTNKGYMQHRRHGLEQCPECRRAHTEYEKARTRRKE